MKRLSQRYAAAVVAFVVAAAFNGLPLMGALEALVVATLVYAAAWTYQRRQAASRRREQRQRRRTRGAVEEPEWPQLPESDYSAHFASQRAW